MNEQDLGELIVRLVGDSSEYVKMLKDAAEKSTEAAKKVEDAAKKVEGFGDKLKGFASNVKSTLATVGIGLGLMSSYWKFEEAERIMLRLGAAVEASGHDVKSTMADYKKFAGEMNNLTTSGKGAVFAMLQQAESFGVTGEHAKRAVRNAMALATRSSEGGDPSSYLRQAVALEQGHAEMLGRIMPILKGYSDPVEKAAKAQEELAKGFKLVEIEGGMAGAKLDRAQRTMGAFTKEIGAVLAQGINPLVSALEQLAKFVGSMPDGLKQVLVTLLAVVATIPLLLKGWAWMGSGLASLGVAVTSLKNSFIQLGSVQGIGMLSGMFKWLGAGAAVYVTIEGAKELYKWTYNARAEYEGLNKQIERGAELQKDYLKNIGERAKGIVKGGANLIGDEDRDLYFGKQLDIAKKELDGVKRQAKEAQKEVEELTDSFGGMSVNAPLLDLAKDKLKNAEAATKAWEKAIEDVKKAWGKEDVGDIDQRIKEQADEMLKGLKLTLGSMGAEPHLREIDKMRQQGLKGPLLEEAIALTNLNKELGDYEKFVESVQQMTEELETQAATFGMDADAARIYKMQMESAKLGVDKLTFALYDGAKAASEKRKKLEELAQLMEKAKGVAQEFAAPEEKYTDRVAELDKMLNAGAITFEVYAQAVAKAKDELIAAKKAMRMDDVQAVNGVLAGSLDSKLLLEKHKEQMKALRGVADEELFKKNRGPADILADFRKDREDRVPVLQAPDNFLSDERLKRLKQRRPEGYVELPGPVPDAAAKPSGFNPLGLLAGGIGSKSVPDLLTEIRDLIKVQNQNQQDESVQQIIINPANISG